MARNTFKSFQWSFVSALLRKVILFAVFLLVAKAITKDELGIFREFSLVIVIFSGLSFFGLKDLLIVKKEDTDKYFKSIFSFSGLTASIFTLLLYFLSNAIGMYYNSDILAQFLRTLAPLVVIEIYRTLFRSYTQKRLNFKFLAIVETSNVVVYSALIAAFYFINLSIRNLIIIFYIGNIIELFLYIYYERSLVLDAIKGVFQKDNWMFLSTTINENKNFLSITSLNTLIVLLNGNLPVIILGYLYNPLYVGVYYLANQLIGQLVVLSCNSLSQVLFPTFTLLSKEEIQSRLKRFFNLVTLSIYPLLFLFVTCVLVFTPYILGDKWIEALPVVAILAFPIGSSILMNPISSIPYVFEVPHYEMIYLMVTMVLKALALYIGYLFDFHTALKIYAIVTVILNLGFVGLVVRIIGMSITKTLAGILLELIPTFILVASYNAFSEVNAFIRISIAILVVAIYLGIIWRRTILNKLRMMN
jgi:O-antigen/teichoic acid export membrane protein